jgi:hypothetical protein
VHRSVAGCGEGGEHLRVSGDRGGDVVVSALAAGVHELPGDAGLGTATIQPSLSWLP